MHPEHSPAPITAPVTVLNTMSAIEAENALKTAILHAFGQDLGKVGEVPVTGEVELRMERTVTGVMFELNDIVGIHQLWKKEYQNARWAMRGAVRAVIDARLGVDFASDFSRAKRQTNQVSRDNDGTSSDSSIWRKIPTGYRYETDVVTLRDKITVSILPFEDGTADATFTWLGSDFRQSFNSLWDAKSSSLKIASSLLAWKDITGASA